MPWVKGQSGNPKGRPKKTPEQIAFEIKCRGYGTDKGFKKLEAWAESDNPAASIAAIKEINGYGFGKPVETQVLDAEITGPSGFSVEDLAAEASELIGEREKEGGGVDSPPSVDPGK